jgi:hypothetical protein
MSSDMTPRLQEAVDTVFSLTEVLNAIDTSRQPLRAFSCTSHLQRTFYSLPEKSSKAANSKAFQKISSSRCRTWPEWSQSSSLSRKWEKQNKHHRRPRCTICHAENPKDCARCGSASYCGKKCQEDWPTHKFLCKSYKPFLATKPTKPTKPTPHHHLAFLFPVDQDQMKLVWVQTEPSVSTRQSAEGQVVQMRMISMSRYAGLLGSDDPETETLDVYKGLRN